MKKAVLIGLAVLVGAVIVDQVTGGRGREIARDRGWQCLISGSTAPAGTMPMLGSAPAPRLTRAEGQDGMATAWQSTGAGDSNYNGIWLENGTEGGRPAYQNESSGKWLYLYSGSFWVMGPTKGGATQIYYNDGVTLPGTWSIPPEPPWAPAPTLSEIGLYDPPAYETWPYEYHWWWGGYFIPPKTSIAPCRATLGGDPYVCIPYQDGSYYGFTLFDLTAETWDRAPKSSALFASIDTYHTGACFDAGDGSNLWASSGVWDDGGTKKLTWKKFAVTPGTSTTQVSTVDVTVPSDDITNPVETAAEEYMYLVKDGTAWKLCSYDAGDASHTVEATFASVTPLPAGYSAVTLGGGTREDCYLYQASNGALYWIRHCASGGTRRLVVYEVSVGGCVQLGDLILQPGGNYIQTWGNYELGVETYGVGDIGSTGASDAHVRWQPGAAGTPALGFVSAAANRRWYLDGDPLIVAGWGNAGYEERPFVLYAEPVESNVGKAALTLTANDAEIAYKVAVGKATLTLTANDVEIVERDIVTVGKAQLRLVAKAAEIAGRAERSPGVSETEWSWVRARIG